MGGAARPVGASARGAPMSGQRLTAADADRLRARLPLPPALESALRQQPIIGASASLDEEHDESEMGAELRIMNADEILSEATETYPGIVAVPRGYIPFAICLQGSGDPYF